ncbi:hypothetical protein [Lactobacillus sp. ESL0681]|nr:hypothetical protein [Lactobacillus sp. ESL0681]WEV40954.1 hypothetical protein OZX59_03280 [Lactobacillus sp. ESL0681]
MKHFSLGVILGAVIGAGLSLVPDKQGTRLGKHCKKSIIQTTQDFSNLSSAITDVKQAKAELTNTLPQAKKTVTELQNDLEYYQLNIDRQLTEIKSEINQLK